MVRRIFMYSGVAVCLALAVTGLSAHENFRVIGTVTKVQTAKLEVKTPERTVSMTTDKQTTVTRDKKIGISDVKAGQSVVVEAYGDNYDSLLVLEIRIVLTIKPSRK